MHPDIHAELSVPSGVPSRPRGPDRAPGSVAGPAEERP